MSKFKISNHKPEIEKEVDTEGFSKKIWFQEVEDKLHFLLKCSSLENKRVSNISNITNSYKTFHNLDYQSLFIWLMSNEESDILIKCII